MSRLPVSVSSKRSATSASLTGVSKNSSLGFNRNSHIPVTIKKANLFTPKDKKLTSFYSASSVRQPFTTDRKHQRPSKPAPDRDEQNRMFEKLVNFLKNYKYQFPLPESKRFFMSVSSTEAARIFEFCIKFKLRDFKITQLEIDVPKVLTMLKYPFIKSVTKSALVSIATRQAAANLLVIFNWLVDVALELVRMEGLLVQEPQFSPLDPDKPVDINYLLLGTICHQTDSREQGVAAMEQLADTFHGTQEELEKSKLQEPELEEECIAVADHINRREEIKLEIEALNEDTQKCKTYREKMQEYIKFRDNETEHTQSEDAKLKLLKENASQKNLEHEGRKLKVIDTYSALIEESDAEMSQLELELPKTKQRHDEKKKRLQDEQKARGQKKNDSKIIENDLAKKLVALEQQGESLKKEKEQKLLKLTKEKKELEEEFRLFKERAESDMKLLDSEIVLKDKLFSDILTKYKDMAESSIYVDEKEIIKYREAGAKTEQMLHDAKRDYKSLKKRFNRLK